MLRQKSKEIYTKIQLLNSNFTILDELAGVTISGNVSITADSPVRTSYSATILIKDSSFQVGIDKKIWLDKYLRVFIGILDLRSQEVIYYPLGIFRFMDNNYTYDQITNTLSISCLDLMADLNGDRGGVVGGGASRIVAGSNIRSAMISTITQLGKVKNYIVGDMKNEVPYDMDFPVDCTVYEIVEKLRDLYPGWETFFDVDGTFICQPIPTGIQENILLDASLLHTLCISETATIPCSGIYNKTEVWGKSLNAERTATSCNGNAGAYTLPLTSYAQKERTTIAFTPHLTSGQAPTLQINDLPAHPIVNDAGEPLSAGRMLAGKVYVVRYRSEKYYLLGEYQIYGMAADTNPESPFYVGDSEENVILRVLTGGEFDNIWSDDLAVQRAAYENWTTTRLQDQITLQTILVPWLGVNQKIEYQLNSTHEIQQYITKGIQYDLASGVMSITAARFYPLYPFVVN